MRKIKKINGFLVVKFNDREKREYEGTALGEYGVIDAEVYTGNLDIDRRIVWRSSTSSGRRFSASARRTTARSTATCSAWRSTSTGRWAS